MVSANTEGGKPRAWRTRMDVTVIVAVLIRWYTELGIGFFSRAAVQEPSPHKARLLNAIAPRFEWWRQRHARLRVGDMTYLLTPPSPPTLCSHSDPLRHEFGPAAMDKRSEHVGAGENASRGVTKGYRKSDRILDDRTPVCLWTD